IRPIESNHSKTSYQIKEKTPLPAHYQKGTFNEKIKIFFWQMSFYMHIFPFNHLYYDMFF
ncbi:MAG: hypothetical protein RR201_02350, partial [Malacoplasma sp.]